MTAIAFPFLKALRRYDYPASVCVERDYLVTYAALTCDCAECRRQTTVRAISPQAARHEFERQHPLAWILSVQ